MLVRYPVLVIHGVALELHLAVHLLPLLDVLPPPSGLVLDPGVVVVVHVFELRKVPAVIRQLHIGPPLHNRIEVIFYF